MRLGIISDIHSNYIALENCIKFLKKNNVDAIYNLGDSIDYFPYSEKVFDLLKSNNVFSVLGNHDAMVTGILDPIDSSEKIFRTRETIQKISKENFNWLKLKSPFIELQVGNNEYVIFVHGTPWDPLEGRFMPEYHLEELKRTPYKAIFMGHTHSPFLYRSSEKLIVNAGSCGLPRDVGNFSCCVLYESESNTCSINRIRFDFNELVKGKDIHKSVLEMGFRCVVNPIGVFLP